MSIATVTSKGQITIPADIRQAMNIRPGAKVVFTKLPGGGTVMRVKSRSALELAGMLGKPPKGAKLPVSDMSLGSTPAKVAAKGVKRKVPVRDMNL